MDLYYRAYGVHELLAHRVAELAGLYGQEGVDVTLKDGSGPNWASELEASAPVSIGVGGATQSCLEGNPCWSVVCVNTQYPFFWLASRPEIQRIEDLRGKRVSGRPLRQAPATFTRITFRRHGLDLLKDCEYVPQQDARVGIEMLRRGELDATLVNRTPFALEWEGFRLLAFIGDEFQASTVGLAVNEKVVSVDAPEVRRLVGAARQTLARMHADRDIVVQAIRDLESETSAKDAGLLYDRYIRPYWTRDGRPDRALTEASLRELAAELGVQPVTYDALYKVPE